MEFDQITIRTMLSFFMKVTATVSLICVSKLYKIVSCIEEDKNQKYYLTYYKINELETYIEALQNDVTRMKETCVHLEDNLAAQKLLLNNAYHELPQEDTTNEVANEVTNELVNEVTNEVQDRDRDGDNTLQIIKEDIINPDYFEEKNKMILDHEYEHISKTTTIDPAQKYKLWKGFFY